MRSLVVSRHDELDTKILVEPRIRCNRHGEGTAADLIGRLCTLLFGLQIAPVAGAQVSLQSAQPSIDYTTPAEPGRRALVIGNADYANVPSLPSVRKDVPEVAKRLRELHFTVTEVTRLSSVAQYEDTILPAFRSTIQRGDLVVIYFSGHGFAYGHDNYIAPADLPPTVQESDLLRAAIPVDALLENMSRPRPGVTIALVDACRAIASFVIHDANGGATQAKGFDMFSAPPPVEAYLGWASQYGSPAVARSDSDSLSIFTEGLLNRVAGKDSTFVQVFQHARDDVLQAWPQRPGLELWSSVDVYLNPDDATRQREKEEWQAALATRSDRTIASYLRLHAVSPYAAAARTWLAQPKALAQSYTSVPPAAVERAWRTDTIAVSVTPTPGIGYDRTLGSAFTASFYDVPASSLGVGRLNEITPTAGRLVLSAGFTTLTKDILAYSGIDSKTPATTLPLGTRVAVTAEQSNGKFKWLVGKPAGSDAELFLPIRQTGEGAEPVTLGRSLREIIVPAERSGLLERDLVDSLPIRRAVEQLRKEGRTIEWVSVSSAKAPTQAESDRRLARIAHAELILARLGIAGTATTAVESVTDFHGSGVRVRFFGF